MRDMLAIWEISKRTVKAWHTLILRPRRYNYVVASVSLGASYAFLTGNEVSNGWFWNGQARDCGSCCMLLLTYAE